MKSLANGEIKVTFNSTDEYRKCRSILTKFSNLPEEDCKSVSQIKFYT